MNDEVIELQFYRRKIIFNLLIVFLQPCHVVYTDFRPTPLQHYIYPAGGDGLFLVEDEKVPLLFSLEPSHLFLTP